MIGVTESTFTGSEVPGGTATPFGAIPLQQNTPKTQNKLKLILKV
jgi:hypothetical protein